MKLRAELLLLVLFLISCKSDKPAPDKNDADSKRSIAEKIAKAHGIGRWDEVNEVKFTFKVDRDSIKGQGRTWVWQPKSDSIMLSTGAQEFKYKRATMDSTHIAADRAFINDKFWLLIPFQLVWDTSAEISAPKKVSAPISKAELEMITINYPTDGGGYTPGDAYDIYYDKDYMIKEWTFRKGNSPEPTLSTTFENYKDFNGIKIAINHKRPNSNWNLNFSDVSITLD